MQNCLNKKNQKFLFFSFVAKKTNDMIATANTDLNLRTLAKDLKHMGTTRRIKNGRVTKRKKATCSKSKSKVNTNKTLTISYVMLFFIQKTVITLILTFFAASQTYSHQDKEKNK